MNSEDIESPEWHDDAIRRTEKALAEGTDRFIDWEEAKQIIREKTTTLEGVRAGISDMAAGRTTDSDEFFEEFFSRYNI